MAIPVAEVNHYIWDLLYDRTGDRLTLLVFAKSMGTSGGWGSTVYDARPLSEEEDAQLVARRRVLELLAQNPLPDDAVAALKADASLTPLAKSAAIALARQQPVVPDTLATFCAEVITQPDFRPNGRQAALHCAEALAKLEPDAPRSQLLLGGALFRAGRLAEAREVLLKLAGDKSRTIEDRDQVFLGCGLLVLAQIEHQFGNAAVVTELLERQAVVASRGPTASTSAAERTLFTELDYETSSIVGSVGSRAASTARFMPSESLLKTSFERLDTNKDGQLTKSESSFTSLWPELIARDQNQDGQLSLPEFLAAMQAIFVARTPASTAPTLPPRREYDEQLALLQDVLQRNPDDPASLAARARLLAASPDAPIRDGKQALADATRACVLTNWRNPLHLDALAMAYAETGDYAAAVRWQQQALADLPKGLAPEFAARLALYQKRQAYRLPGRYEEVPGWGRLADRAGDCQVEASGAALRITVPGSLHDLSGSTGNYDAPRVVSEVTGDFTAQVKVVFPLAPREYLNGSDIAYHGAGLTADAGLEHFLRVERAAWHRQSPSALTRMVPYVEYCNGGNRIGYASRRLEEAQTTPPATWLRLTRRGPAFAISSSSVGATWTVLEQTEIANTTFPARVRVGVTAINNSSQPLAVEFSEWKLTQP
jgi:tetratricopeptide (TPR) repeat protein